MVTGYEQRGERFWWVDRCPDDACQRVFVAAGYQGSNLENYHYFWRCLPKGRGDVRILRIDNDARMAYSNRRDTRWRQIDVGDVLAPGTFLRLGPCSEVHWQRDRKGGTVGILATQDEGWTYLIETSGLRRVVSQTSALP